MQLSELIIRKRSSASMCNGGVSNTVGHDGILHHHVTWCDALCRMRFFFRSNVVPLEEP